MICKVCGHSFIAHSKPKRIGEHPDDVINVPAKCRCGCPKLVR